MSTDKFLLYFPKSLYYLNGGEKALKADQITSVSVIILL